MTRTVILAVLLAALLSVSGSVGAQQVGEPAPAFELATLDGVATLAGYRGAPLVVNFWATWCPPCREELPLFEAAAAAAPELQVLLVNAGEERETIARFLEEFGLALVTAVNPPPDEAEALDDPLAVAERWRVRALPTTFFVDGDGIVRSVRVGEITESALAAALRSIGVAWTP